MFGPGSPFFALRNTLVLVKATPVNRWALELYFNLCLECLENRNVCACHDRGYN